MKNIEFNCIIHRARIKVHHVFNTAAWDVIKKVAREIPVWINDPNSTNSFGCDCDGSVKEVLQNIFIFRERFFESGALKEKISLTMVAQAHHQNEGAGERNGCTVAQNHTNTQGLTGLSPEESKLLDECEKVITKHFAAFFEVGSALLRIREGKLYRAESSTFEEYCRKRWGMGRFNAYRQMQAAGVMKNLLTMVNTPPPESERQVRPLVGMKPEAAGRVWKTAVQKAGGEKVTGEMVKEAARELNLKREVNKTRPRESWQDWIEPLLKEALAMTRAGNRDAVQELLYKAILRVEVGRSPESDV
jgi:hypothetical protein